MRKERRPENCQLFKEILLLSLAERVGEEGHWNSDHSKWGNKEDMSHSKESSKRCDIFDKQLHVEIII